MVWSPWGRAPRLLDPEKLGFPLPARLSYGKAVIAAPYAAAKAWLQIHQREQIKHSVTDYSRGFYL